MMKLKYKNHNVLFILLVGLVTLVFSNMAYAKDEPVIQSNSSHFSIAQLEEAGLPDIAQSMTKSNNFYVEENDNKLKFIGANSSNYCVFTIQNHEKSLRNNVNSQQDIIKLENIKCFSK